jgi:hypothetical protein
MKVVGTSHGGRRGEQSKIVVSVKLVVAIVIISEVVVVGGVTV